MLEHGAPYQLDVLATHAAPWRRSIVAPARIGWSRWPHAPVNPTRTPNYPTNLERNSGPQPGPLHVRSFPAQSGLSDRFFGWRR